MDEFLIDGERHYSYQRLLDDINASLNYCRCFRAPDLYSFFRNLVKGIVAGKNLTLIDSDITAAEIPGLEECEINKPEEIGASHLNSVEELIDAIANSKTEFTIFTSGTTGQPKKVVHTIGTLTRNVRCSEQHESDVWGFAYNPTHMAGLQVFFQAIENGNTLINVFSLQRDEALSKIEKHQVTHISATPTFYRMLLPFEKEYGSVKRITFGGEKSDVRLYDNISKIFPKAKITNVYASTEAGSLFASCGDNFKIPQSIIDKIKIEDNELLLHHSILGDSESFTFDNDYYHTGDIIEWIDEAQGIFRFLSRKNELINVGGYKVNPGEVEDAILTIPGVKETLVYGKKNSILGNILCADIVKEPESELDGLAVKMKLAEALQDFKIPRRIKFVEEMEVTRTGKLRRSR